MFKLIRSPIYVSFYSIEIYIFLQIPHWNWTIFYLFFTLWHFQANFIRTFSVAASEMPVNLTLVEEHNGIRNIILNSPKNR